MSAEFRSNTTVFLTILEVGRSKRSGIGWRGFTLWLLQTAFVIASKWHSCTGDCNLCPTKMEKSNVPLSV